MLLDIRTYLYPQDGTNCSVIVDGVASYAEELEFELGNILSNKLVLKAEFKEESSGSKRHSSLFSPADKKKVLRFQSH